MSSSKNTHGSQDIGCLDAIEGLYAWLDGELKDPESAAHIEEHISHCQSCYSRAEIENLLTERIRKTVKQDVAELAPETLQQRLRKLMAQF